MANMSSAVWRRSSKCDNSGGSCVEVAFLGDQVLTRDSKDPSGVPQVYDRGEWAAFIGGAKAGEFDGRE